MDFAKLMSAQIKKSSKHTAQDPGAKFQKRSDIEASREAAYRAEQAAAEREKKEKVDRKRKADDEEAARAQERELKRQRLADEARRKQQEEDERAERERRKTLGLPEVPWKAEELPDDDSQIEEHEAVLTMGDDELDTEFRAQAEPVRLFAEDRKQRLKRYLRLTRASAEKQALLATADQPIPTTLEPVAEADTLVASGMPSEGDVDGRRLLARRLTTWFNLILREWAIALDARDQAVKETFAGQAAASSRTQAVIHLKPLFRKLERLPQDSSQLPSDLLIPMVKIVRQAQMRQYVDANDGYLKLSIGNAAWPIGVTMVGIHERSARERLNESGNNKAHIMSDESTRKFLQSIKRCLSFAQTKWPPEDVNQLMG